MGRKAWEILKRFWGWFVGFVVGLLLVARWVSDMVGRSTFMDDLTLLLQRAKPVTDFFARQPEWLFYPPLVALILTGLAVSYSRVIAELVVARKPSPPPSSGSGSAESQRRAFVNIHTSLSPNMTLRAVATYITTGTGWSGDDAELVHDIRDKLALGKLPAWAAAGPDKAINEVAAWVWREADLDIAGSAATIQGGQTLHRIKLDKEMVMLTWAPRRNNTTGY